MESPLATVDQQTLDPTMRPLFKSLLSNINFPESPLPSTDSPRWTWDEERRISCLKKSFEEQ